MVIHWLQMLQAEIRAKAKDGRRVTHYSRDAGSFQKAEISISLCLFSELAIILEPSNHWIKNWVKVSNYNRFPELCSSPSHNLVLSLAT